MKKTVGISLLVLVVLLFGVLPLIMGIMAKRATIAAMNASLPENSPVTLQLVSYQRHWYTSDVVFTVNAKALTSHPTTLVSQVAGKPATPTAAVGVTVTEKVYHGPIVITQNLDQVRQVYIGQAVAKGTITTNPTGTSFQSLFPNLTITAKGQYQEMMTVGLTGRFQVNIKIPPLNISSTQSPNWLQLTSSSLSGSMSDNMQKFGFGFNLPFVNLVSPAKTYLLKIRDAVFQSNAEKNTDQLWLGWMNLQVKFIGNQGTGPANNVQNLVFSAKSELKDKLLDSDSQLNFTRLVVNDSTFGPGIAKLSFKRFDPKAQAALIQLSHYDAPVSPWAQAAMMREATQLFSKLIASGAQIAMNPVNVKTSNGDINLSTSLQFPDLKGKSASLPTQLHDAQAGFKLVLPKVVAQTLIDAANRHQIELQVNAGIASSPANIDTMVKTQRTNQVNHWLSQGLIVSQGDNYVLDLTYNQGKTTLNGKNMKDVVSGSEKVITSVTMTNSAAATPNATKQTSTPSVKKTESTKSASNAKKPTAMVHHATKEAKKTTTTPAAAQASTVSTSHAVAAG